MTAGGRSAPLVLLLCAALAAPAFALDGRAKFIQEFLSRYEATNAAPNRDASLVKTLSEAALAQTKQSTTYDPSYVKLAYPGGDVPLNRGVCTDVIVRAYRKAGIDLQVDVHEEMKAHFSDYPKIYGRKSPDPNIDHRRVPNLMVFFSRRGTILPITKTPESYSPGDIVAWDLGGGVTHIGLVADRMKGKRYLVVHNIGQGPVLEDVLFDWRIIGHFRYAAPDRSRQLPRQAGPE
jgi:uncharacterized protein YijF (DUF1287 family)